MMAFLDPFYCDPYFDSFFCRHGFDSDYGLNPSHCSSLFSCFSPFFAFFQRILIATLFFSTLFHYINSQEILSQHYYLDRLLFLSLFFSRFLSQSLTFSLLVSGATWYCSPGGLISPSSCTIEPS